MKFIEYIKITLIGIKRSIFVNILVFAVFPLMLGLGTAYFTKEDFKPENNIPIIKVSIEDEDKSLLSKSLVNFLGSESVNDILKISTDGEVKVNILKGYEENLLALKETEINLEKGKESSNSKMLIVQYIMDSYSEEISKNLIINDKILKMNTSTEEKQKLMNDINELSIKYESEDIISTTIIKNKKSLSSFEYYSISYMTILFFIIVLAIMGSGDVDEVKGLGKRIISLPLTRVEHFNYNLASNFTLSLVFISLYVFVYRILGLSFKVSIIPLIVLIIIHAIFLAVVASLLSWLSNKKYINMIIRFLFILQLFLTVAAPEKVDMKFGGIVQGLKYITPDFLISKTYKNLVIFNNLSSINTHIILIIIISLILYLITVLRIYLKEREK